MKSKTLSYVKKFLLISAGIAGLLVLLSVLLLTWVYFNPKPAWSFAQRHFLPEDLKISWQTLNLDVTKEDGWVWRAQLQARDFAVAKQTPHIAAQIDDIDVDLFVEPFGEAKPIRLKTLKVISKSAIKVWASAEKEEDSVEQSPFQMIKSMTDYLLTLKKVDTGDKFEINLREFDYFTKSIGDSNFYKIAAFAKKENRAAEEISFKIEVEFPAGPLSKLSLNGVLTANSYQTEKPFLSGVSEGTGLKINFTIPFKLSFAENTFNLESAAKFKTDINNLILHADPKFNALVSRNLAKLTMSTSVEGIPGPVKSINNLTSEFSLPLRDGQDWSSSPLTFLVDAPVELAFIKESIRQNVSKSCECVVPKSLPLKITGTLFPKQFLAPDDKAAKLAEVSVSSPKIENKLFSINLAGKLKVLNDKHGFYYEPSLDSDILIKNFKNFGRLLTTTGILIPAPLSVLDGTVEISAKGPMNVKYDGGRLQSTDSKIQIQTLLNSKRQKANLRADVLIRAASDFKRLDVAVNTKIDALEIELPPLDPLRGLPKIKRDARIQMQPSAKKTAAAIKMYFDFNIETSSPNAIRFFSTLVPSSIPISLKMTKAAGNSVDGFLHLDPFNIVYLRRTLAVDSLKINFTENESQDFPLEGHFHVDQTAYRIFINVGGTLGTPLISMTSEPYLDRADIISVLLYDRLQDQLVGGDAETSGNVQAAMADKAIGLFGLWAFANTPIRSFTYNPVTKVYAAEFQIGEGLTAGVGTATDQNTNLEIRKRISKRWVLTASWVPQEDQTQSEAVTLQWEKRF